MKKPAWMDEFVAFAVKGNAMALAVGTIIGAAFSTITKSLTDDIPTIMQAGVSGIALSGAILRSDNPAETTHKIITTLNNL